MPFLPRLSGNSLFFLVMAAALGDAGAMAQDLSVQAACAGDRERLCFTIPESDPRTLDCLLAQRDKLSLECVGAIEAASAGSPVTGTAGPNRPPELAPPELPPPEPTPN